MSGGVLRFSPVIPVFVAVSLAFAAPAGAEPEAAKPEAAPAAAAPTAPSAGSGAETQSEPEKLGALVRKGLDAAVAKLGDADKADAAALKAFYDARKDEPLWIEGDKRNAKAEAAIAELGRANDWGLDAKAFEVPAAAGALLPSQAAEQEMKISLAVLKYGRFARGGRIEDPAKQLATYLDRMPQIIEPKAVLEKIAASAEPDATLRGFHPQHPQFEKLRQRYLELLKASASADAIVKMPKGPKLSPGQKHADVALLRKRLKVATIPTGKDGKPDETLYDDALVQAVKAYQTEKGLRADGIVGAQVRASLNDIEMPSPRKILANMEQWRWMPENLGSYYIWVNIPEFLVRVVKDGKIVHEERVVTGLPDKQTPVFSAEMELVTFHPPWNVPESIKVRELYPSLARGGGRGFKIMRNGQVINPSSVDWSSEDIRKFDIQQPPGAANALGVVKFSFPNKHTVYMHDTPSKDLFNETSRAFSHGCMRVRNPLKLAEVILDGDKGWDAAKVDEMAGGDPVENPVTLDKKIPVHITYFTSWIADDGSEQRFKDVYGHEERIALGLEGRWNQIVRLPDHLAPVSYPKVEYAGTPLDAFFKNVFGGF